MSEKQQSINDWGKDEKLSKISQQLLSISQGTSTVIGERFFQNLAQCLAAAFHVRYAFIGKVIDFEKNIAQMSPLWDEVEKEFNNSIVWNLTNTPCEDAVLRETRLIPKNVQKAYPLAPILKEFNIESYFGIPLISSSGKRLGLISVMDDKPMTDTKNFGPIIQIFADRCASEMDRLEIDAKLKEASISKKRSEDYLSTIANNTKSVIYMKDLEGRYLLINKRYEDLFNLKNEQVQGKTDLDLFPKEIAEIFMKNDRSIMESGEPFEGEEIAPHKDGLHTYISIKVPLFNSEGAVYGICGISTDISERKKVFEKLKSSEEKLKSYFDMPLVGIAITSPEKGWLEVNQKLCDIFSYTHEELTRMTWAELTHPDDLEADIAQFDQVLAGEIEGYSMEKRFIRKDTRIIHASISARCIRKSDGNVDYFVAIVEDITERKEIEEKILHESKFASESPLPVMRVCGKGKIVYLNKPAEKIGRKYNFKIGHSILPAWQENLCKAFSSKEIIEFEDEIEAKTYNFNMVPIVGRDYLNIYGLDITSRKNAEKELEAFASIASHDLQAPLRKISLFGDRLIESAVNLDDRSREYIHRMQNSAIQMSNFIEDMLSFSIISAEQTPFEKIDLQEQINELCEELSHIVQSANGEIKFSNLPEIEGNKRQIVQLFNNLIVNSLKYKQEDKTPVIKIYHRKTENGFYELLVEDNGIGFDEKYADKIFEPFQRLHDRSKYNGTGLGLTICKKVVDRHNGRISVKSHLGEGTVFEILLPETQKK